MYIYICTCTYIRRLMHTDVYIRTSVYVYIYITNYLSFLSAL